MVKEIKSARKEIYYKDRGNLRVFHKYNKIHILHIYIYRVLIYIKYKVNNNPIKKIKIFTCI